MKRYLLYLGGLIILMGCGQSETAVTPTTPAEAVAPTAVVEAPAEQLVYTLGSEADEIRTFSLVPSQSSAAYLVDEEFFADALPKYNIQAGEADVVGRTQEISGELLLNFGNPALLESGTFVVNLVSLTTDQNRRDNFIRDNALESNKFPQATFTANAVSGLPAVYTEGEEISFDLTGELGIRDVTKEVTFAVTAVLQNGRLTGVARLPITMSTFGIDPPNFVNTLKVKDDFVIQVEFTAVES